MSGKKKPSLRAKSVKVKTAKGRKLASSRWLQRHLNDPFVQQAHLEGYRSRAAYKLTELNDKFDFIQPGMSVIDFGCAPGSWLQVLVSLTHPDRHKDVQLIGIDLQEVDPLTHVTLFQKDIFDEDTHALLEETLRGPVDVILSDMAPPTSGHRQTDHLKIINLAEETVGVAETFLKEGGSIAMKIFQGSDEKTFINSLKEKFEKVSYAKPKSSRKDSPEIYVVAKGYKGA